MREADAMQKALFSFTSLDGIALSDYPLRSVKALVDESLRGVNGMFYGSDADTGRASIARGKLLRALLSQVRYSVGFEQMLLAQIRYNMLFRCFAGLAISDALWDHSVFPENRDRMFEDEVIEAFFAEVMMRACSAASTSRPTAR
jgi:transposase